MDVINNPIHELSDEDEDYVFHMIHHFPLTRITIIIKMLISIFNLKEKKILRDNRGDDHSEYVKW